MAKSKGWTVMGEGKKRQGFDMGRVTTSLDLMQPHDQYLVDELVMNRKSNMDDLVGKTISVSDVIYIGGVGDFENSEDWTDRPYLGLVGDGEVVLRTGSGGIIADVLDLINRRGAPAWKPSINLTIEDVLLKGKKKTYRIKPVPPTKSNGKVSVKAAKTPKKGGAVNRGEVVPF